VGQPVCTSPRPDGAAVVYLPVGGSVAVKTERLPKGWKAEWFDPRSGKATAANTEGDGVFKSPDAEDWVLVFRTRG
jgi:hypothetical protein